MEISEKRESDGRKLVWRVKWEGWYNRISGPPYLNNKKEIYIVSKNMKPLEPTINR